MDKNFAKVQQRANQYNLIDGTFELFFGAFSLLMAIFLYIQAVAALPDSLWSTILTTVLFILVIPGGVFLIDRLVRLLKEHVTYPRTGYIAPRRAPEPDRATKLTIRIGVPILVVVIVTLLLIYRSHGQIQVQDSTYLLNWMPELTGILMGCLFVIGVWTKALPPRFYVLAILLAAAGFVPSLIGFDKMTGMAFYLGLTSLVLFISGGVTLWVYLRNTRPPGETPTED